MRKALFAGCQAYNGGMKFVLPSSFRRVIILAWLALPLANTGLAQTAVPGSGPPPSVEGAAPAPAGRPDRAIQRIHTEDAGSRIDEVRVGGETQSITVQPKTGGKLPAYEVKPLDNSRGSAASPSGTDSSGSRVWNVLKF
jgi:hypothetical protein